MGTDATDPPPSDQGPLAELAARQQRLLDERDRQIAELQLQARQLQDKTRELEQKHAELELDKLRLRQQLLVAMKKLYGPRGDRLAGEGDVAQLLLEFAATLEAAPVEPADLQPQAGVAGQNDDAAVNVQTVRRVSRRKGRRDLGADEFDHLPLIRKEHDLAEDQKVCPCCSRPRTRIGQEISWQIEYIPGSFQRIEHVRMKYACANCEQKAESPQIELADKPPQPIDKGMAGPGLLAYVVTSKYADYVPLYRLENIFARNGFEIDRVTQSIWCRDVARIARPLYDRMVQRVLGGHVIHTDETVMPMLAPGKTQSARLWVYVGDDANPYNVFDFTQSRSRDGPAKFLRGYDQVIVADAYGGYDGICLEGGMTQAGCWAHARRKFVDTRDLAPEIADTALLLIGKLFTIEQQAKEKGLGPADRLLLRQSHSQPIVAELRDKLPAWKKSLLPKHPVSQAIGYLQNQWNPLTAFLKDGAIAIHNNVAEQEMKRIALNRKNSLFVGNERGGHTAAILSSLTSTCRRHGVDPQVYLTQLLANLPEAPISQLDDWLPDRWQPPTREV
jgi:transposase